MSIDIDDFEESSAEELEEVSNAERVMRFLFDHRDRAWKAKKIAERADVNENSVHPVLNRLEEQGLVRHKGSFWAITDDRERLQSAYEHHRLSERLNEWYGEEDRDEWLAASENATE